MKGQTDCSSTEDLANGIGSFLTKKGNWMACQIRSSIGHCSPPAFILQMLHRIYPSYHSATSSLCCPVKGSRNAGVSHNFCWLSPNVHIIQIQSNICYPANFIMSEVRPVFSPIFFLGGFGSKQRDLLICPVI